MSKVYDLLIEMSQDLSLQKAFARDSLAVMAQFELSPVEQQAVLAGDLNKIYEVAGSRDLVICKQIWVYDPRSEKKSTKKS